MSGDTEASEEKVVPETLNLRANPRPVTRINRRALIILSATGLLLIFAATFYALKPPSYSVVVDKELYNIKHKQTPEELVSLPDSYRDYTPPVLGAPLPGELGAAVLDAEQRAGLEPVAPTSGRLPFQTDHVTDMERAERIRIAQRAQQGRESSVFFQLSQREADGNTVSMLPKTVDVSGIVEDPVSPPQNDNDQTRKNDFIARGPEASIYNPYQLQTPLSPYQVMAGTVIAASLITGLNSDLPGQVIAQVTQPVYDTVTGNHLLIPQGARLMGSYDSVVAFGQQRALVVWQRLIFPDGSSIVIDNLPATDRAGYAGLEDQVDFHTWRLIKGIGLSTLFSIGSELAFDGDGDLVRAIQQGSQDSINRAGQRIVERNINIQPTITIRPGYPLRVIVHKDIILTAYGDIK
ncbi:conjugal transfer protein TrbI [Candidatus Wolfebacteria bacterium]|nr:MAG: conjugal transfer protein TrbI [Candidatus Wolfebacteria bacterium]